MTTATDEHLLRDFTPVEVYAPGVHQNAHQGRAFVTDRRVVVWTTDSAGMPKVMLDEPITGELPERNRGTQGGSVALETARGPVYLSKGRGCGCGSTLRAISRPADW